MWNSAQTKEVVPIRPKTPLVDTRNRPKTPSMGVAMSAPSQPSSLADHLEQHRDLNRTPVNALADQFQNGMSFQDGNSGYNNAVQQQQQQQMQQQQQQQQRAMMNRSRSPGRELDSHPMQMHYENGLPPDAGYGLMPNGYPTSYESDYGRMGQPSQSRNQRSDPYAPNPYVGGSYSMDGSRPMDYGYVLIR